MRWKILESQAEELTTNVWLEYGPDGVVWLKGCNEGGGSQQRLLLVLTADGRLQLPPGVRLDGFNWDMDGRLRVVEGP